MRISDVINKPIEGSSGDIISQLHKVAELTKIKRMTLSVLMITNKPVEERVKAIGSIGTFADQIVIVETDERYRYEEDSAAEYHFYKWDGNFSNARNFAQSKCTSDFILWLDDDEEMDPETMKWLRKEFDEPIPKIYGKDHYIKLMTYNKSDGKLDDGTPQVRIYPNIIGVEWSGKAHESVMNSLYSLEMTPILLKDSKLIHHGYADMATNLKKSEMRNIPILLTEEDIEVNHYKQFLLGIEYQKISQWGKALEWYEKADRVGGDNKEIVILKSNISYRKSMVFYNNDKYADSLIYAERSDKQEARFMKGMCQLKRGLGAKNTLISFLDMTPEPDAYGCDVTRFQKVAYKEVLKLLKREEAEFIEKYGRDE